MLDCASVSQSNCAWGILPCLIFTIHYHLFIYVEVIHWKISLRMQAFPCIVYFHLLADFVFDNAHWFASVGIFISRIFLMISASSALSILLKKQINQLCQTTGHKMLLIFSTVIWSWDPISYRLQIFTNTIAIICMMFAVPDLLTLNLLAGCALLVAAPAQYVCERCKWIIYLQLMAYEVYSIYMIVFRDGHDGIRRTHYVHQFVRSVLPRNSQRESQSTSEDSHSISDLIAQFLAQTSKEDEQPEPLPMPADDICASPLTISEPMKINIITSTVEAYPQRLNFIFPKPRVGQPDVVRMQRIFHSEKDCTLYE